MIDAVALLRDLIRCASVTPAEDGVLDRLGDTLAALGFSVERLVFSGDGSYPVANLFATIGTEGRHLLFAGHTDVVPVGDAAAWTHPPFAGIEAGGHVHGRGAVDMKSGIAAFMSALPGFLERGRPGRISLAITNDEEADAVNGTAKLLAWAHERGHRFDFAIVGEPSSSETVGDSIKIGRRGSLNGLVEAVGVQGHVAYPERAHNPLPALARAALALTGTSLDKGTAHFPASNLEITSIDVGNPATNVIPARGTLRFNIRFNDLWDAERLEHWIGARLGEAAPGQAQTAYRRMGPVARSFIVPTGEDLETMIGAIASVTGRRPALSTAGGTSDARFIADHCPVIECGLVGTSMHQVDERVPVADIETLRAIYAAMLDAYFA